MLSITNQKMLIWTSSWLKMKTQSQLSIWQDSAQLRNVIKWI